MNKPTLVWDGEARAGYMYFRDIGVGEVAKTVELEEDSRFLVDFNQDGEALGIEFLSDVPVSALLKWANKFASTGISVHVF